MQLHPSAIIEDIRNDLAFAVNVDSSDFRKRDFGVVTVTMKVNNDWYDHSKKIGRIIHIAKIEENGDSFVVEALCHEFPGQLTSCQATFGDDASGFSLFVLVAGNSSDFRGIRWLQIFVVNSA